MDDQKIALLGSIPYSGKPPWQPRQSGSVQEEQRVKAIQIIKDNSNLIKVMAKKYNIPPESIAGAILWEAVENPYPAWRYSQAGVPTHRKLPGVLGKIHADQWFYAHGNQKIPRTSDYLPTVANLNKTKVAIEYIAALIDIHAANYEQIVGLNVRKSPGVLTTLYHGGDSYRRAVELRDRRYQDRQHGRSPQLPSVPEKEMGEYVEKYQKYLRTDLLNLNDLGLNDLSLNEVQEFDLSLNSSNDISATNDVISRVSNANNILKSNINSGNGAGVIESLNDLTSIYREQSKLASSKELRREYLYNANNYLLLASKVKSGKVLLHQLEDKIDQLSLTDKNSSNQIAPALSEQYTKIVDAYTDKNGKVDLVSLNKDMKNNNADQETINGVNSLVTPDMQLSIEQSRPKMQNTL